MKREVAKTERNKAEDNNAQCNCSLPTDQCPPSPKAVIDPS